MDSNSLSKHVEFLMTLGRHQLFTEKQERIWDISVLFLLFSVSDY